MSAWNVCQAFQSAGTLVVVRVGQDPPANVILRLCLPDEAMSVERSMLASSFPLAPAVSRFAQTLRSSAFSKSKRIRSSGSPREAAGVERHSATPLKGRASLSLGGGERN